MVVYGQVLVACKFWWHWTFYGQVWWSFSQWSAVKIGGHSIQQQTQEPPQEELVGGQVNVKFGGHVNVKLGYSDGAGEAEVAVLGSWASKACEV